jgi:predicted N-acetyltransferase YhbS
VLVRPEARGRLVGTRLVMAACAALRLAGCRRVVAPAGGEGFLARLGFRQADGVLSRPLGGGVGGPAAQV